ncbi:MAG: malto-oligosyltrehalose synthase, partial [Nitrospirales bacterium]
MTGRAAGRIPVSTYRVQFNRNFTFTDAARLAPYWHALGITDCYGSSYLKAVPGSMHGYDLVDPTKFNPEVGTEETYREFIGALQQHGLGHVLDIVPNHMGIGQSANAWWLDVLENGPCARHASFFDVDWHPVKAELENKVLLPILGDQYGIVLENQEIVLSFEDGGFFVSYYSNKLPIDPKTSIAILAFRLDDLTKEVGDNDPHLQELQSIITSLRHLPARNDMNPEKISERYREKDIVKRRLHTLTTESDVLAQYLRNNVERFNGTKGDPRSFDLLDEILNHQAYRLSYWRVASDEVNYRRFFDINELAAIRMEDPEVFRETHQLIFRLLEEGSVTGLRIDHVDGLYDPGGYLRQLQGWALKEWGIKRDENPKPLFLVVEKILAKDEPLPESWPVHGTTGYEVLNLVNGLFVNTRNERAFTDLYARLRGAHINYDDLAYESKKLIMRTSMAGETHVLGHHLNRISERDRRSRDFTLYSLTHAIREVIACFPVYRTYVTDGPEDVLDRDRAYIRLAVAKAKRRNPALTGLVFDFLRDLLLKQADERTRHDRELQTGFAMKFQQATSPVTAKGIEDTAFYNYNRLMSLNEVGGEPEHFGVSLATFHKRMRERHANWPLGLSASSTHDTKRSEDVRARINVLSELPQAWKTHLTQWTKLNKRHKTEVDGQLAPDRNEEYLLYQNLIGSWPLEELTGDLDDAGCRQYVERIHAYMHKALKEAKIHSSWVNPNQAYDEAVRRFVDAILDRAKPNPFLDEFLPFQAQIAQYGMYNSLSQTLVKMAAPGSPDFYQGTELWDFSLVDPDNRRPVDYDL